MRIAIISNHPAPYRDPFLARISRRDEMQVEIFNERSKDRGHGFWDMKEHGYSARDLYPSDMGGLARFLFLLKNFALGSYDFVLWPGFLRLELTASMLVMAILGKRYGFVADTIKQGKISGVQKWIKTIIIRRATLIFVPGNRGVSFWENEYCVSKEKIVKGAYALDGRLLEDEIEKLRKGREIIRRRYGVAADDVVFLMVANMTATRHYPVTTEAFVRFANGRSNVKLVIVGNGPDLPRMKEFASVHHEIVALGGVSFHEMLSLYAMADVYVHGGCEPASTALVIGAIAKLPLLSTKQVGCFFDVLEDGKSGIDAGDPTDVECFVRAFQLMDTQRNGWKKMGDAARDLSKALDVERIVNDFCRTVQKDGRAV